MLAGLLVGNRPTPATGFGTVGERERAVFVESREAVTELVSAYAKIPRLRVALAEAFATAADDHGAIVLASVAAAGASDRGMAELRWSVRAMAAFTALVDDVLAPRPRRDGSEWLSAAEGLQTVVGGRLPQGALEVGLKRLERLVAQHQTATTVNALEYVFETVVLAFSSVFGDGIGVADPGRRPRAADLVTAGAELDSGDDRLGDYVAVADHREFAAAVDSWLWTRRVATASAPAVVDESIADALNDVSRRRDVRARICGDLCFLAGDEVAVTAAAAEVAAHVDASLATAAVGPPQLRFAVAAVVDDGRAALAAALAADEDEETRGAR
jgi:hypothetical protein